VYRGEEKIKEELKKERRRKIREREREREMLVHLGQRKREEERNPSHMILGILVF
jgi:hypothetical protein